MNMLHIAALVLLAIDDALETTAKLTRNGPSRRAKDGSPLHRRVELMSDITQTVTAYLNRLKKKLLKAEAIIDGTHEYPEDTSEKKVGEEKIWAMNFINDLPSPEAVRKKVDCVIRAFTKRASAHPHYGRMCTQMLLSNDETKRLKEARVIWDEDGRPKKADGAPDLRFKPREKMNVKFVHPRPAKTPVKAPVKTPVKAPANTDFAEFWENAESWAIAEERRLARREAAVLARRRTLRRTREQHKRKVLKENECHIREKNFWQTLALKDGKWIGHRTCDLCTEILRTDDSLGDKEKKALKRCKNYHFTKPKKQGEKPTRFKHRKTRSKKKVPDRDIFGAEVWTVREMKEHSDTDALQYLAGTPEHKARSDAANHAAILAGLKEFEDETQIQEDARTLEEATHMARKVTLPTTRGAPPMAESAQ